MPQKVKRHQETKTEIAAIYDETDIFSGDLIEWGYINDETRISRSGTLHHWSQ